MAADSSKVPRSEKHVLLVDDDEFWFKALSDPLKQLGYTAHWARDGLEGLSMVRESMPDILIADYYLPKVDGMTLCSYAKTSKGGENLFTVILSCAVDEYLLDEAAEKVDALVAKDRLDEVVPVLMGIVEGAGIGPGAEKAGYLKEGRKKAREFDKIQRSINKKIRYLKKYLDTVLEELGDGVLEVDTLGRVFFANSSARQLLGIDLDLLLGKRLWEIFGLGNDHYLARSILDRRPLEGVLDIEFHDRALQVKVFEVKDLDGDGTWLVIVRDVTTLREAKLKSIALNEKLHRADRLASLGQMAAATAHEINNPLSIILPNIDLMERSFDVLLGYVSELESSLAREGIPAPAKPGLERIRKELPEIMAECKEAGTRIQATTESMRNLARNGDLHGTMVDVCELLESSLALVKTQIKFKARILKDLPKGLSKIPARRSELAQAFFNVLLNAAQAIEESAGDRGWIRVSAEEMDDFIKVEIANTGEPIPREHISKIFDPFFTTKADGVGTGLGLSICYDTIRKHGGYIEVRSGEDIETVFKIWLPLETGIEIEDQKEDSKGEEENGPKPRVLLVDDEKLILKSFKRLLAPMVDIETVSSGEAAVELLCSPVGGEFDLVLCDLMMPNVSGIEVYEKMKSYSKEIADRFVFLTGGSYTPETTEFLRNTTAPTISKPMNANKLVSLIIKYANQARTEGKVSKESE